MLQLFNVLLPKTRTWSLTMARPLRAIFQGLSDSLITDYRTEVDLVWLDIFPATTREIAEWENHFGLQFNSDLTESERRDALAVEWADTGGQSPSYIQNKLQSAGFNVYVHDHFTSGGSAIYSKRNPLEVIYGGATQYLWQCGDFSLGLSNYVVQCGENQGCGDITSEDDMGYILQNREITAYKVGEICCGDNIQCGDGHYCGDYDEWDIENVVTYPSSNYDDWGGYIYIGAETYGQLASIPAEDRQHLETLCLQLCPAHLHIGMLVEYT